MIGLTVATGIVSVMTMTEPEQLNRRITDLNRAVDFWNDWMVAGLVVTAIAACWVVIATRLANQKAQEARAKATELEVEALSLRRELVRQGSRPNLLTDDVTARITAALKPFSGQKIEVRYPATAFNNSYVDNDTMSLAMRLHYILVEAGWVCPPLLRTNDGGTSL